MKPLPVPAWKKGLGFTVDGLGSWHMHSPGVEVFTAKTLKSFMDVRPPYCERRSLLVFRSTLRLSTGNSKVAFLLLTRMTWNQDPSNGDCSEGSGRMHLALKLVSVQWASLGLRLPN